MDYREAVAERADDLRAGQILGGALFMGAFCFLAVTVFMPIRTQGPVEDTSKQLIDLLLMSAAVFVPAMWAGAFGIYRSLLGRVHLEEEREPDQVAQQVIGVHRATMIVSLALCEGAALFAIVICLLARMQGVIDEVPQVWALAGVAVLVLTAACALVLPTPAKLERLCSEAVQRADQGLG
jgi:hypothetical protein